MNEQDDKQGDVSFKAALIVVFSLCFIVGIVHAFFYPIPDGTRLMLYAGIGLFGAKITMFLRAIWRQFLIALNNWAKS